MTFDELYELQCKVFEPATADFSMSELKSLLSDLLKKFPHIVDDNGKRKPYKSGEDESVMWFKCYDHVITLINIKRDESTNNKAFWISVLALIFAAGAAVGALFQAFAPAS